MSHIEGKRGLGWSMSLEVANCEPCASASAPMNANHHPLTSARRSLPVLEAKPASSDHHQPLAFTTEVVRF